MGPPAHFRQQWERPPHPILPGCGCCVVPRGDLSPSSQKPPRRPQQVTLAGGSWASTQAPSPGPRPPVSNCHCPSNSLGFSAGEVSPALSRSPWRSRWELGERGRGRGSLPRLGGSGRVPPAPCPSPRPAGGHRRLPDSASGARCDPEPHMRDCSRERLAEVGASLLHSRVGALCVLGTVSPEPGCLPLGPSAPEPGQRRPGREGQAGSPGNLSGDGWRRPLGLPVLPGQRPSGNGSGWAGPLKNRVGRSRSPREALGPARPGLLFQLGRPRSPAPPSHSSRPAPHRPGFMLEIFPGKDVPTAGGTPASRALFLSRDRGGTPGHLPPDRRCPQLCPQHGGSHTAQGGPPRGPLAPHHCDPC